jgi:type II secretory pathway component PulK
MRLKVSIRGFEPRAAELSASGSSPPRRKGVVLLAVLVVVVLLTLAAYEFGELMLAEYRAAESSRRAAQARALADSGVHYVAALVSNPDTMSGTLNNNPYDNAPAFQGLSLQLSAQPNLSGRFSIVSPVDPDDQSAGSQPFRYGVKDESGKINLNALMKIDSSGQVAHDMLMKLPNMTEDIANAILDWMDPDSDTRTNGAEDDYYSTLSPPYHCKNGPLDTLEELLLVKGVTPDLLFGNDLNRNGMLDPDEDNGLGVSDPGWSAYLTVTSREQNVDSQGNPRIYINDSDLEGLYEKLSSAVGPDLANYIIAYRLNGPSSPTPPAGSGGTGNNSTNKSANSGTGSSSTNRTGSNPTTPSTGTQSRSGSTSTSTAGTGNASATSNTRLNRNMLNFRQGQPRSISSLFELVNSTVSIPMGSSTSTSTSTTVSSNGRTVTRTVTTDRTSTTMVFQSPLNDPGQLKQTLPLLLDETTTTRAAELPPRININTASQTVLSTLPGLTDADVQNILEHRPSPSDSTAPDPIFQTPAWLLTEANLPASKVRSLDKYITARSQVYRVQSVGTFDKGGPVARVEAVIDTNLGRPRIVYYRDLTELGKGFDLSGQ